MHTCFVCYPISKCLLSPNCLYHTKTTDLEKFLTLSITCLICQLWNGGLHQRITLGIKYNRVYTKTLHGLQMLITVINSATMLHFLI